MGLIILLLIVFVVYKFVKSKNKKGSSYPEEITGQPAENAMNYVVLDVETTGLNPDSDKIIEIGMIKVIGGMISDEYETLVYPGRKLDPKITEITGLTNSDLQSGKAYSTMATEVASFIGDLPIVAHNSKFDAGFVSNAFAGIGLDTTVRHIDTIKIAKKAHPELGKYKLEYLIKELNLSDSEQTHRAMDDARCTLRLYEKCKNEIYAKELLREEVQEYKTLKADVMSAKTPVDVFLLYPKADDIARSAWETDEQSAVFLFGSKENLVSSLFEKKIFDLMKTEYEKEKIAIQKLKTRRAMDSHIEKFRAVYESNSSRLSESQRKNLDKYTKELCEIRDMVAPEK